MVTRRSERVNLNVMEFSQDLRVLPQSFKQWINCHPEDKHQQNVLCYSAERDLSTEWCYPPSELLGPWHFSKSQVLPSAGLSRENGPDCLEEI